MISSPLLNALHDELIYPMIVIRDKQIQNPVFGYLFGDMNPDTNPLQIIRRLQVG